MKVCKCVYLVISIKTKVAIAYLYKHVLSYHINMHTVSQSVSRKDFLWSNTYLYMKPTGHKYWLNNTYLINTFKCRQFAKKSGNNTGYMYKRTLKIKENEIIKIKYKTKHSSRINE